MTWLVLHNKVSDTIVNVIFSVPIVVVDNEVIHWNGVNFSPVKFDTVLVIDNYRCQYGLSSQVKFVSDFTFLDNYSPRIYTKTPRVVWCVITFRPNISTILIHITCTIFQCKVLWCRWCERVVTNCEFSFFFQWVLENCSWKSFVNEVVKSIFCTKITSTSFTVPRDFV